MQRLKSRQHQVPNGFFFRESAINWDSRKVLGMHPSFETLVTAVISARRANPHQRETHRWSLDRSVVGDEVEAFNVKVCQSMGWTNYLAEAGGGAPPPFVHQSPAEQKQLARAAVAAKKLWDGIKTISDWLKSDIPSVPKEQAEKRAATCVACPFNGQGDLTSWFTLPAAAAIKRQLELVQKRDLGTSLDEQLGVCAEKDGNGGCLCPLRMMVHVPIALKLQHMSPQTKAGMHPNCWVLVEEKELTARAQSVPIPA